MSFNQSDLDLNLQGHFEFNLLSLFDHLLRFLGLAQYHEQQLCIASLIAFHLLCSPANFHDDFHFLPFDLHLENLVLHPSPHSSVFYQPDWPDTGCVFEHPSQFLS